jgi:NAD(P)H dehydrogenase (quinone)
MIVVTGASGALGRLVVKGLPTGQVVAAARTPEKVADLGVPVRVADYDRPETLVEAFTGADKVLLVSSSEVGKRLPQHTAVVEAAKKAGVPHLVYTSVLRADTSTLGLAPEHKATEQLIRESGIPFTFLRNGWYTENYTSTFQQAAQTGGFIGSAGAGRVASATRADYAEAAVAVLTGTGHEGRVYELAGDTSWSYPELARALTTAAGREVTYTNLTADQHREALTSYNLPAHLVDLLVDSDHGIAVGQLDDSTGELGKLIGRPTTPLTVTLADVLK